MNDANLDNLITRVIDRRATPADWVQLEALAGNDPAVWRELALAQKQDTALAGAVREAASAAERVSLPYVHAPSVAEERVHGRMRMVGAWGGWAAAALVALAFATGRFNLQPSGPAVQTAGPKLDLPDMLSEYLAQGKEQGVVVGELPDKVVLDTVKTPDGRTEIVFIRQIVERTQVGDLYKAATDEAGNPRPIKVQLRVTGRKSAL